MSGARHTLHRSCRLAEARSNCSACLHKKVSTNNLNKGKAALGLGIAAAGWKMAHTEFFSNVAGVSSHRKKSSSEFVEGQRHDTVTEPKRLVLKLELFHGFKKELLLPLLPRRRGECQCRCRAHERGICSELRFGRAEST
jgi:hypothetical protein